MRFWSAIYERLLYLLIPILSIDENQIKLFEQFLIANDLYVQNPFNVKTFSNGASVIELAIGSIIIVDNKKKKNTRALHYSVISMVDKEFRTKHVKKFSKINYDLVDENKLSLLYGQVEQKFWGLIRY